MEQPEIFPDFHDSLVAYLREAIQPELHLALLWLYPVGCCARTFYRVAVHRVFGSDDLHSPPQSK